MKKLLFILLTVVCSTALASHPVDNELSTFKPGKGLYMKSKDGKFAMVPRLRAQFLYSIDDKNGSAMTQNLQIRRARLQFIGHTFGKHNRFKVELALSP